MALKAILNRQTDFTGEFPEEWAKSGLWRFNESAPDENTSLADSSGKDRDFVISGWSGTTASLPTGYKGHYFRFNTNAPTTEKTYLKAENGGTFFENIGERIIVGGWIRPTTYSISNTYCPIFNTRQGPGQPIFYISLYQGRPRLMLYSAAGSTIMDEAATPSFSMVHNGWYFIAAVIETEEKKACLCLGDRSNGTLWVSDEYTFTGELNRSCTADVVMGMHANTYYYAGGLDDWFLDVDSELTMDDLAAYFRGACVANGGDMTGTVNAQTVTGGVELRKTNGQYPSQGILYTMPVECSLSGTGRVSASCEYVSGVTAVTRIETSTSDDLISWSNWTDVLPDGKLASPNRGYIRFRATLATADATKTPVLKDIRLFDIPKAPYERIGFARPVWFTDLCLQEGNTLTGYHPHTEIFLKKLREGDGIKPPVWFNGVVRSEETVVLFNCGKTSAPLDIHIYPTSDMAAGSVALCQGVGGQRAVFPNAVGKDADLALLAESRSCTKDGVPEKKEGFFQYSVAWDSKHKVTLEDRKSARVLFSMQEMEDYRMPILTAEPEPGPEPEPEPELNGFIFPFPEEGDDFILGEL